MNKVVDVICRQLYVLNEMAITACVSGDGKRVLEITQNINDLLTTLKELILCRAI